MKAVDAKESSLYYSKKKDYGPFVYPTFFIMVLVVIFPAIFLYVISLTNYELGRPLSSVEFVGLQNYIRLFSGADRAFWHSIRISLLFMFLATTSQLILGFFIATLLNRKIKFKPLVFGCLIVPITIMPSIAAQIWKLMLDSERGVINYFLSFFDVSVPWLSFGYAYWSVLMVDIWQWTPFMALIIYAGLSSLPVEPYESALIDGATSFQLFRYITLPLLKPLLLLAVVLRSIDALRLFDLPFVLTLGGPGNETEFMSMRVFRLGFFQTNWIGRAAAMAVVLMLCTTIISRFLIWQMRKGKD
ncbi:MAG: sugar ABC transporter permease [Oscillospiraceae bacterium]|nr:sugar ABC transporter permease [Oscillospiraceae bacterium]